MFAAGKWRLARGLCRSSLMGLHSGVAPRATQPRGAYLGARITPWVQSTLLALLHKPQSWSEYWPYMGTGYIHSTSTNAQYWTPSSIETVSVLGGFSETRSWAIVFMYWCQLCGHRMGRSPYDFYRSAHASFSSSMPSSGLPQPTRLIPMRILS
jgi:hypothetical protein